VQRLMAAEELPKEETSELGFSNRGGYSLVHRTIFVYDALMADECVKELLRGGEQSARVIAKRPGTIAGYKCLTLKGAEWIAAAVHTGNTADSCEGVLLERVQPNEVDLIDAFQPKTFDRLMVQVAASNGVGGMEEVEALMYVCPSDLSLVGESAEQKSWTYPSFRTQHMQQVVEKVVKPIRENYLVEQAQGENK